jgi:preprotein translocase subunit Sec61beta
MIYQGPLRPFEKILLRSPLVPWSYFASNFYHNVYWYPFIGRKRVQAALQTPWGQLFKNYGNGEVVLPGIEPKTVIQAGAAIGILGILAGVGAYLLGRRKK